MTRNDVRFVLQSAMYGFGYAGAIAAATLGSLAIGIGVAKGLMLAAPATNPWIAAVLATAICAGLLVAVSAKWLLPWQDYVETRLCRTCWNKLQQGLPAKHIA